MLRDFRDEVRLWERTGHGESHHGVSFPPERLRAFLSSERFRLLQLIRRKKPRSVYELAKMASRDRMAVVMDLKVLRALGFVNFQKIRGPGRARSVPVVPYKAIRIAIDL